MSLTSTPAARPSHAIRRAAGSRRGGAAPRSEVAPDRRPRPGVGRIAVALVLLGALVTFSVVSLDGAELELLALLFVLTWAGCLVLLTDQSRGGVFRASTAYLAMFGLFHGGLLVTVVLQGQSAFLATAEVSNLWLYGPRTGQAVRMVAIGMLSFSLAAALVPFIANDRVGLESPSGAAARRRFLSIVGPTSSLAGIGLFLLALSGAGFSSVLRGGYTAFIESAQQSPGYAYAHILIGLGTALAVLAGGRTRTIGWSVFGLYAALAFPLGLRGEVLFPLVALLVLEARQGRRLRRTTTVVAGTGILLLIAVVRQTRLSGIGALFSSSSLVSPLDAIAEMGYSLRPSVVVAGWHVAGQPFQEGWTVAASPVRFVSGVFGLPDVVPPGARLFTVEIADRAGSIGGSPVAEAFHNAGMVGVLGVMTAFGLLLGQLERRSGRLVDDVLLAAVLIPLLVQIRNGLLPLLVQVAIGLVLVAAVDAAGYRISDQHASARGP